MGWGPPWLAVSGQASRSVLQPSKQKRKFSSFFKSLVIELDKELYGPDNHLVEVRCAWLCCRAASVP